nr:MAG TPA: hypothetical protein [Caudoviricetes sp.]
MGQMMGTAHYIGVSAITNQLRREKTKSSVRSVLGGVRSVFLLLTSGS